MRGCCWLRITSLAELAASLDLPGATRGLVNIGRDGAYVLPEPQH